MIAKRIGESASAMVRVVPHNYEGRDLIMVHVTQALRWYYLDGEDGLYVRRSGSTSCLRGAERDAYQKENPR